MPKTKIMLVDDEPNITEILCRALMDVGYECYTASNVDDALKTIEASNIKLVISDIRMPGRSGLDLLNELVGNEEIAVLMLTAVNEVETAINALKVGAYDYIVKPFNVDEVQIAIERALNRQEFYKKEREFKDSLKTKVKDQRVKIRKLFIDATDSLINALEAKDSYTAGHSRRVTIFSTEIARELNFSENDIQRISLASRLHDIGKIGIKEAILSKPDKLSDVEYEHISSHTPLSVKIIEPMVDDKDVVDGVKYHHEHLNGRGTFGLKNSEIPIFAKIISVADAFDAMTSDRPYRPAMPYGKAISILEENIGTQFDGPSVKALTKVCTNFGHMILDDNGPGRG